MRSTTHLRDQRRRRAVQHARAQGGVLSRRQLYALGINRWEVTAEVRAKRWEIRGRQTVAVSPAHQGALAQWYTAVFEVGSGAALDGVTALAAAGLTGFEEPIHVSMPKSGRPRHPPEVIVHETRRRQPGDVVETGVPRVRAPTAAIRGALWARTDRQAALILLMAVNQRLVTGQQLLDAFSTVRRHRRRSFLGLVLVDVIDGVRAMGELDFAGLCRQRGLPEPDRQVVRDSGTGRVYLDAYWERWGVVVEVDGLQHQDPASVVNDAIRQNRLALDRDRVLRIPVLGLRLSPEEFLDQVAALLRSAGCPLPAGSPLPPNIGLRPNNALRPNSGLLPNHGLRPNNGLRPNRRVASEQQ